MLGRTQETASAVSAVCVGQLDSLGGGWQIQLNPRSKNREWKSEMQDEKVKKNPRGVFDRLDCSTDEGYTTQAQCLYLCSPAKIKAS